MPIIPAFTDYVAFETIRAAPLNARLNTIRDSFNSYALLTDVARTVAVTNVWSATQTFSGGLTGTTIACTTLTATGLITTVASAAGGAGFRLPHGVAPTSPVNGDWWTTASVVQVRITGATQTLPFGSGTSGKVTRWTAAGTIADSSISDDGTYVSSATQPRCTTSGTPGTAVGTSTSVDVTLATELMDVGAFHAGAEFTIPASAGGLYLLTANITMSSGSGTTGTIQWKKNGAAIGGSVSFTLVASGVEAVPVTIVADLAAADVVKVEVSNTGVTNACTIDRGSQSVCKIW